MSKKNAAELAEDILVVPFVEMEPHIKRGAVIVIDESLNLAEVGTLVANDDSVAIGELLSGGKLSKASHLEYEQWRQHKQFFKILIVQPFVLAQNYVNLTSPEPN
jgi:hypothetical protein